MVPLTGLVFTFYGMFNYLWDITLEQVQKPSFVLTRMQFLFPFVVSWLYELITCPLLTEVARSQVAGVWGACWGHPKAHANATRLL